MAKTIKGVEILAVGTWNGDTYAAEDLADMVANSQRPEFKDSFVPVKLGHSGDRDIEDGAPAMGTVENLRLSDDKQALLADLVNLPDLVYDAIKAKRFASVSIEAYLDVRVGGTRIGPVLTGLAILGSELPAVSGLKGLEAYLQINRHETAQFRRLSRVQGAKQVQPPREKFSMEPEVKQAIDSAVAGVRAELTTQLREKDEAHKVEMKKKDDELAEFRRGVELKAREEALTEFATKRTELTKSLDALVQSGELTPALYAKAEVALEKQKATYKKGDDLSFPVELGMALLKQASDKLPDSQGGGQQTKQKQAGDNAGDLLDFKVREYMAEKKLNYSAAWELVTQNPANKDLVAQYAAQGLEAQPNATKGGRQ